MSGQMGLFLVKLLALLAITNCFGVNAIVTDNANLRGATVIKTTEMQPEAPLEKVNGTSEIKSAETSLELANGTSSDLNVETASLESVNFTDNADLLGSSRRGGPIRYVPMPKIGAPKRISFYIIGAPGLTATLKKIASSVDQFIERNSRGKIKISGKAISTGQKFAKGPGTMFLTYRPGASSAVPVIGNGASAKHELGHEFGMGHSYTRRWASQTQISQLLLERDPYDPMTVTPDVQSLNAGHLHFMQWFSPTEEAYAVSGQDYVLRVINDGNRDFQSLKAVYYQVPQTDRLVWFSYVRVEGKGWSSPPGMPGTAIAIHASESGGRLTYFEGLVGLDSYTHIRSGLIIQVSQPTALTATVTITKDPKWVLQGN